MAAPAAAAGKGAAVPAAAPSKVAEVKAVQSATFVALKAKNKSLKAELAKLEKLDASVNNKDSKAKVEQKVKDVTAVKTAFDHFDADASGFIDKAEFAALSADLGELLDDDELSAAVKEIDSSGDGKISFNEFIRWWSSDKKSSSKSGAKIALLKTKLKAREFKAFSGGLIRQLSSIKPDSSEFVKHRIALTIGDLKDAKSSLNLAVSFNDGKDAQALQMPSLIKVKFALKAGATAADVEAERKKLDDFLKGDVGLPHKTEVDAKANVLTVAMGVPEDPFAMAAELGLDLKAFVKEVSVKLELPFSAAEVLDGKDGSLPDMIQLNFETKLEFRKALVHTLAQTLPGAADAAFGAFLENMNLSMALGSVKDLAEGMVPPEGLDVNRQRMGVPPPLFMAAKGAKYLLKPNAKAKIAEMYAGIWSAGMPPEVVRIVSIMRKVISEPTQIVFSSGSGVAVTVDIKNLLPTSVLPDLGAAVAKYK